MESILQAILKDNPLLRVDVEVAMRTTDMQAVLIEEMARQDNQRGHEPYDEMQQRVFALVEAKAGRSVALQVDELIGRCMCTYADTGFALGWHTARHPEWLIFAQPGDDD